MTMKFNFDGRHAINSSNVSYISLPFGKDKVVAVFFFLGEPFFGIYNNINGPPFILVSKASQKRQMQCIFLG